MSESIARAKWVVRGVRNRQEAEIVEDGAVHQRDGTIVAVGKYDDIRRAYPQLPVLGFLIGKGTMLGARSSRVFLRADLF